MFIRFQKSYDLPVYLAKVGLMHIKAPCTGNLIKVTVWARPLAAKSTSHYNLRKNGTKILVSDLGVPGAGTLFGVGGPRASTVISEPVTFGDILSLDINTVALGGNHSIAMQCDFET